MNIVNKKNWSIINGLTGIFVIPLIFYSFNNKLLPGGYLCIDVLFVVAGYAMTLCIEKNASKNLFEFIYNFYLNGIKKYIPSLAFFTIVFGILISFFSQRNETSLVSGITSLLGLSNIYFWRNGINYFEDNIRLNPFASTWALSVLAQFFFIYPIYLWFCGLKQNKKNILKIFLYQHFI